MIPITQAHRDAAATRTLGHCANRASQHPRSFGADYDRMFRGYLAEEIAPEATGGTRLDGLEWDLEVHGTPYDVKALQAGRVFRIDRLVALTPQYHVEKRPLDAGAFLFYAIDDDCARAWCVGEMPLGEWYERAKTFKRGEWIRDWMRCIYDCWALDALELHPPLTLAEARR